MGKETHTNCLCVEFEGGHVQVDRDLPVLIWYGDPNNGLSELEGFTQHVPLCQSAIDIYKGRKVWLYQPSVDSWVRVLRIY
jgi:hypothetical protein